MLGKKKLKFFNTTKPPLQIFSQGSKKNTTRNINIMRDKNLMVKANIHKIADIPLINLVGRLKEVERDQC